MRVAWRIINKNALDHILLAESHMRQAGIEIEAFTEGGGGTSHGCLLLGNSARRVWVLDKVGRVTFETATGSFVDA